MRRSDAHEYRQAYNAQAVVCADGAQLTASLPPQPDSPLGQSRTVRLLRIRHAAL